jgi:hypothetical protein
MNQDRSRGSLPLHANQVANLIRQFVNLFIQQDPAQRSSEYATLGEAIAAPRQSV